MTRVLHVLKLRFTVMERLSGYLFFIYECAGILVTSTCITQWVLATPTLTMPWISLMFEFYLNHSHYKISQLSQCHHETHGFNCDLTVSWWRPHFSQSTVHEHDRLSLVTRQELGFGNAKMSQFGILRKKGPKNVYSHRLSPIIVIPQLDKP